MTDKAKPADWNNYPGLVQGERVYEKDRATEQATPADQEPVGKNWQERVQLRMLSTPENPNAPDVIGPAYNPVEVELRATPADHIGDAAKKVEADSVPVAWQYENAHGNPFLTHKDPSTWHPHDRAGFKNFVALYAQPPQNAADHIEAQSVRDAVIEECAKFVENGYFLHDQAPAKLFADECAREMRNQLKSAPPQKPSTPKEPV